MSTIKSEIVRKQYGWGDTSEIVKVLSVDKHTENAITASGAKVPSAVWIMKVLKV